MSKSTIYRVMKGYQKPSYELLELMYEILDLNAEDKRKLNYYISTVDMDEKFIKAQNSAKHLLFEQKNYSIEDFELVYYKDGEKYIKSLHEILNSLSNELKDKNAKVNAYIVNSTDDRIMSNIEKYTKRFSKHVREFNIEHLIGFSSYSAVNSVHTIESIIPMLKYPSYNLMYTNTVMDSKTHIFSNYVMVTCSYSTDDDDIFMYYIFSLLGETISTCYTGYKKDSIYDMFSRNYNYIKESYIPAITNNSMGYDINKLMRDIYSMENDGSCSEVYLFKKSPCYKRIPSKVYRNIRDKIIKSGNVVEFMKSINKTDYIGEQEACLMLNKLTDDMVKRYKNAQNTYTVDILSKKGLADFVETGMLYDHFADMPPFDPEDIVAILQDMKRRHLSEDDAYNLFILGDDANTNFILTIFKEKGFLIEKVDENNPSSNLSFCMIEDMSICNILYEFARDYVPSRLAMIENNAMS